MVRIECRQRGCVSRAKVAPANGLCPVCRHPLIGADAVIDLASPPPPNNTPEGEAAAPGPAPTGAPAPAGDAAAGGDASSSA